LAGEEVVEARELTNDRFAAGVGERGGRRAETAESRGGDR
jgi:hypothetical protein